MATTPSKRRKPAAKQQPQWIRADDTDPMNGQQQVHFSLDCGTIPQIELVIGVFQAVRRNGALVADLWDVELCAWVNGDSDRPLYSDDLVYACPLREVIKAIPVLQRNLTIFAAKRLSQLAGEVATFLPAIT